MEEFTEDCKYSNSSPKTQCNPNERHSFMCTNIDIRRIKAYFYSKIYMEMQKGQDAARQS